MRLSGSRGGVLALVVCSWAAVFVLVACGSDSGGEGATSPPAKNVAEPESGVVTRDAFVAAADAICAEADAEVVALGEPESLDEVGAFFEQLVAIQEDQIERLRALELPADDAERATRAYDLFEQIVERAEGAQESIAAGDFTVIDAVNEEVEPLQAEADQIAGELGLQVCGRAGASDAEPAAALEAAGCELFAPAPSQSTAETNHVLELPEGFEYTTYPPTQGPHHPETLLFGLYTRPVGQLMLVHNLEHGGMYVQYGDQVSTEDIAAIAQWWDADPNGLIVAPLPELDVHIALGAWTTEREADYDNSVGRLAYCQSFDQAAFDAFKQAYRGKGPERIPISALTPGLE